ncbi:MAG: class I SAM-dependent methyltransferase [Deltaproteobacteria bacterium]|nr:class I SAM-dependent methyltransferase [Deltaproteobacteria bacterium]
MEQSRHYLMENAVEAARLDVKTDPDAVRSQAAWCGVKAGLRVLDLGCGSGRTTAILREMVEPGGSVVGIDYSADRIAYARHHFGNRPGMDFLIRDLTGPIEDIGKFDIIWVRFVLEYYRRESPSIVRNLKELLSPDGFLCLIDLDCNCLGHYELPPRMATVLPKMMAFLDERYNFDTYAGRKLYSYLYDLRFKNIEATLMAHHLIYGEARESDLFNWLTKVRVSMEKMDGLFTDYPGGAPAFLREFENFFRDPGRFTYTPMILCKGQRPDPD